MKMIYFIILQFFLFSLFSCEKNDKNDGFPITLEYETIDSIGNTVYQFDYSEKIIFSFKITNNSDSLLYYETNFFNEEFFKVYNVKNEVKTVIGKPYKGVYCDFIAMDYISIQPNQTIRYIIPWIPESNNCCPPFCNIIKNLPLEKGEYISSFSSKFNFFTKNREIEYISDIKTFTIIFNVK